LKQHAQIFEAERKRRLTKLPEELAKWAARKGPT
jgi:hypothetical protein